MDAPERQPFAVAAGHLLRRVRATQGLTLRRFTDLSGGRFTPTAVAAYERGERNIPLFRFYEMARVYGVDPGRLLSEVARVREQRPALAVVVSAAEALPGPEAEILRTFLRRVRTFRSTADDTIVIRSGDLEVLAVVAGRSPAEFRRLVGSALQEPRTTAGER